MYHKFFSSLRVRLMLIVLISVFPMLGLILHSCGKERAYGMSMARSNALELTRSIARFENRRIENAGQCLIDLSHTSEIMERDRQGSEAILRRFVNRMEGYASFAVVKPNGFVFASWPSTGKTFNLAHNFWYRRIAKHQHRLVSGYHFCGLSDRPVIIVARPLRDSSGAVRAILAAGLDLANLNHELAVNHYPAGTTVTVADRHGIVLAHYPYSKQLIGAPMQSALGLDTLRNRVEGVADMTGLDGAQRIYGFTSIGQKPDEEYVVVAIPQVFAYASARKDLIRSLGLLLGVVLLSLLGAWWVGEAFVLRKVRGVLTVMGQLAGGDLTARSGVADTHGELNQLAHAFDQMAERLERREKEASHLSEEKLRRSEARIQLIIDKMPIACIVWDTDLRVTLWNASAEALFGYSEAEALGKQPHELMLQEEAPALITGRWEKLLDGQSLPGIVNENRTREGRRIICEWSSTPLEGPDGSVVAVVSMVQDITERKRAEQMLHKLTKTLKMLGDCNQLLVRAESEPELTEGICRLIVEVGGYRLAWVGYAERDDQKSVRPVAWWGYHESYIEALRVTWSDTPQGWGPAGTAIRTGKPVVASNIQSDSHLVYRADALKWGYRSCIGLPLLADGGAFGVLLIYSGESDVFDSEERRLLEELAEDLAYGIGALRTREKHGHAVEALRESERQFRELYEEAPIPYQSLDENGNLCAVNEKWLEMFGYAREEVIGRWLGDFLTPAYTAGFGERFELNKSDREFQGLVSQVVCKDGQVRTVEVSATRAYNEKEQLNHYQGVMRDITDAEEADKAIQTLMEGSVAITGNDYLDGIVRRLCEWLGAECAIIGEFVDDSHFRVLSIQTDDACNPVLRHDVFRVPCSVVCEEGYCAHPQGGRKTFPHAELFVRLEAEGFMVTTLRDSKGTPMGLIAVISRHKLTLPRRAKDVMRILAAKTAAEFERLRMEGQRDKMERQLRQAQKMEAIGTLAGGIAHDFNNILGIIYGYSEMSLLDVPAETLAHSNLENIIKAADRAKDLVQQILAFSRQSEQELKPLQLGPIVKEVVKLLRAALPSTIQIQSRIQSTQDIILGDPTHVHQVLMNLCTNAKQAMAEKGGVLEVTLGAVSLKSKDLAPPVDADPGAYVQLTVKDTGAGMTEAVRERIFEPYFTTKQPGEGTGLGLAVVHGIVKASGGAITVESEPATGTTFSVFFPRLEGLSSADGKEDAILLRGEGTVLLVDDEPDLLHTVGQRLEYLGYQVVSCSNGAEALEVFRESPDGFRAVVTDQTMPQMTGMNLAKEILKLRPEMPIILCTGYSEGVGPQQVQAQGIRDLLMKPLNLHCLAAALRRLADE